MAPPTCTKCLQEGHAARDCSKKKAVKCFACHASGHQYPQCPLVKSGALKRGGGGRGSRVRKTSLSEANSIDQVLSFKVADPHLPFMDAMADLPSLLGMLHRFGLSGDDVTTQLASLLSRLPRSLSGCLSSFDHPDHVIADQSELTELLATQMVWGTVGCSPKHAGLYEENYESAIISIFTNHRRAVAWGPIGLDYGAANTDGERDTQKTVCVAQIKAAVGIKKPIVVCACTQSVGDVIALVKENVPSDHPVHWTNYVGSPEPILALRRSHPHLYLGLTSAVAFSKQDQLRELAFDWPLDRLFIESNSPANPHPDVVAALARLAVALPSQVVLVAHKIAGIKRKTAADILKATTENLGKLYGMVPCVKPGPSGTEMESGVEGEASETAGSGAGNLQYSDARLGERRSNESSEERRDGGKNTGGNGVGKANGRKGKKGKERWDWEEEKEDEDYEESTDATTSSMSSVVRERKKSGGESERRERKKSGGESEGTEEKKKGKKQNKRDEGGKNSAKGKKEEGDSDDERKGGGSQRKRKGQRPPSPVLGADE